METLFACSYIRSKKIAEDFYRYMFLQRPFHIFMYVFIALAFILNVVFLILWHDMPVVFIIITPIYFALQIFQYHMYVNSMVKRDLEIANGAETVITCTVTENGLQCATSSGSSGEVSFDKIKKVTRTKTLILLHTKAKLIYIFPKDAFTIGTPEQFLIFLAGKGLKGAD